MGQLGIQTSDDRREENLPGETLGTGPLYRVWEGPSEGVTGYPPPNPSWRSEMGSGTKRRRGSGNGGDDTRIFRMTFLEKAG